MGEAEKNIVNTEKYQKILEAAISVIAQEGFFNSTVSKIAQAAGVADGTIYLYFKNKNDILLHFCNHKTKVVFGAFQEEVNKGHDARSKLLNLIKVHLSEFQKDRNMAVVFQAEARQIRYFEVYIKDTTKTRILFADFVGQLCQSLCLPNTHGYGNTDITVNDSFNFPGVFCQIDMLKTRELQKSLIDRINLHVARKSA